MHEYDRKKSSSVSKVEKENSRALFTNPKWKKKVTDDDKKKNFKCHFCKEKGHFAFDCKKKKDAERRRKESASFCHETSIKPEFALQVDDDDDDDTENFWWLDSGCSQHMTCIRSDFSSFQTLDHPVDVILADKSVVYAVGRGGSVNIT